MLISSCFCYILTDLYVIYKFYFFLYSYLQAETDCTAAISLDKKVSVFTEYQLYLIFTKVVCGNWLAY